MRKSALLGLLGLWVLSACADTDCGGCVGQLDQPFPNEPRVWNGVQARVSQSGLQFVEDNLPTILDTLLVDGLVFEIPPTDFDVTIASGTICETPCPVEVDILGATLSLLQPDQVRVDSNIDVTTDITMHGNGLLGDCVFPVRLVQKPIAAQVTLQVDTLTGFVHFDVGGLNATISEDEYQIECGILTDLVLEALKGTITDILNSQLQDQLGGAIDDLVAEQTCLPCDFYGLGCPAPSSCNGDGFCESNGACLVKPLGMVGRLDLGELLSSVDPTSDAQADLLIALAQNQLANQQPFVRANGLELRVVGGTYADLDACVPAPQPAQIPPTGNAPLITFGNLIPGLGDPYHMAISVADRYLDHLIYQLWRSGLFCLSIDTYGVDMISSGTLALLLPSIDRLTGGENVPVRLSLHPLGVPNVQVGAGTFLPDGSVDAPILVLTLPDLRMDFWLKLHGRWVKFLSLTQSVIVDLALQFTADNSVLPILGEDSIHVVNVRVADHELLGEPEDQLRQLVPDLIRLALPQLAGLLEAIAIPPLQGFVLQVKSLQGDVPRGASDYFEFMSIYADLDFAPAPAPAETRAWLDAQDGDGVRLGVAGEALEHQVRLDGGFWSPFRTGAELALALPPLPGRHLLEVRSRRVGDYRSLDPTPVRLELSRQAPRGALRPIEPAAPPVVRLPAAPEPVVAAGALSAADEPQAGCATGGSPAGLALGLLALTGLALRRRRA